MHKKKYNRIAKQIGISYFFMIISFIFGPILIFVLTRNLSTAEYGIYSILSVTIAVLSTFLTLSLNSFIITKLPGQDYTKRIKSMASILFFELIFLVFLFAILFIPKINRTLLSYLKIGNYWFEFNLALVIIFIGLIYYILTYYIAAKKEIELQSFLSFLYNYLWVIVLILFFFIFKKISIKMVFSLWLICLIISFVILLVSIKKDIAFFFKKTKKISLPIIKKALIFSLPLVPVSASAWIITFSDRYMINYLKNPALTGIYSLSYSLVMLILSFSMIVSSVLNPYVSKAWSDKGGHHILFNAMLKYNLMVIFPASVGLFVLRKQIITLISGTEYLLGSTSVAILVFFPLFAFLTDLYSKNLALRDKTKLMALIYVGGGLLNIILNYFLIKAYGINGAAIATTLSYFFMASLFYIATRNQFSWDFNFLKIGKIAMASILMGVIIYFINPQVYLTKILAIIAAVILYSLLLIAFKVFTKEEYSIIKHLLDHKTYI